MMTKCIPNYFEALLMTQQDQAGLLQLAIQGIKASEIPFKQVASHFWVSQNAYLSSISKCELGNVLSKI